MRIAVTVVFTFLSVYGYGLNNSSIRLTEIDSTDIIKKILVKQFITDCETNIVLQNTETNISHLYWAANSIRVSSNYRIESNSGSNITMKAGKVIVLKPKTVVVRGNKYLARIEPCSPPCPDASTAVIPKGISPNNDNVNDTFDLTGMCIKQLKIFNRYGKEVYTAADYTNDWYGQSDGGDLPAATYYYSITLYDGNTVTGWLYLQR